MGRLCITYSVETNLLHKLANNVTDKFISSSKVNHSFNKNNNSPSIKIALNSIYSYASFKKFLLVIRRSKRVGHIIIVRGDIVSTDEI